MRQVSSGVDLRKFACLTLLALVACACAGRRDEVLTSGARQEIGRSTKPPVHDVDSDDQDRLPEPIAPVHPRTGEVASVFACLAPPMTKGAGAMAFWAVWNDGTLAFYPRAWAAAQEPEVYRETPTSDSTARASQYLKTQVRLEYRTVAPSLARAFIGLTTHGMRIAERSGRYFRFKDSSQGADVVLVVEDGAERSVMVTSAKHFWQTPTLRTDASDWAALALYVQMWRMAMQSIWESA